MVTPWKINMEPEKYTLGIAEHHLSNHHAFPGSTYVNLPEKFREIPKGNQTKKNTSIPSSSSQTPSSEGSKQTLRFCPFQTSGIQRSVETVIPWVKQTSNLQRHPGVDWVSQTGPGQWYHGHPRLAWYHLTKRWSSKMRFINSLLQQKIVSSKKYVYHLWSLWWNYYSTPMSVSWFQPRHFTIIVILVYFNLKWFLDG